MEVHQRTIIPIVAPPAEAVPANSVDGVQYKAFDVGNTAAQGNATPWNVFIDHSVVEIDGLNKVFDPSYGNLFSGTTIAAARSAWEDGSVKGVRWFYILPTIYSAGTTFTPYDKDGESQVSFS